MNQESYIQFWFDEFSRMTGRNLKIDDPIVSRTSMNRNGTTFRQIIIDDKTYMVANVLYIGEVGKLSVRIHDNKISFETINTDG